MSNLRDREAGYTWLNQIVASRFELKLLTDAKLLDYVYTTIF